MKKLLLAMLIALLSFSLFAQGATETKPEEIRVMLANHPYGDLLKEKIPEFEAEYGIKVNYEQLQESQLSQALATEFATASSTVDVFMTRPLQEGLMFIKNNWYSSLADYDFSDYPQSTVDIGTKNGVPYIVPLVTEWQVLYYRKDLFKAAGISVPKTFDELKAAAAKLTTKDVAGFGSRGKGAAAVTQMSSYVYNFGGRYIQKGEAVFDSPQAVKAIKFYGEMLGNYGPQGVTSMSWENLMPVFQAGKLAMWTDASVFYGQIIDPEKTAIPKEDIGIADLPAGPADDSPFLVVSWGMAIANTSTHKDAAMKFLTWATSQELALEGIKNNITMAANSAWKGASGLMNEELIATQAHAAANGYPYDRPFVTSVGAARDLIGEVIIESINTKGTSTKLEALAKEKVAAVNELLKTDGEYHNLPY